MTDHIDEPTLDIEQLFRTGGYGKRYTWVKLQNNDSDHDEGINKNTDSDNKEARTETPKSAAAQRKAEQRERDRERGWAECHAKAPDDDDARKLISLIASAIGDPEIRAAFWITVENHRTATIGAKVVGLKGLRKLVVNALLGE